MKKPSFIIYHLSFSVALVVSVALAAFTACSSSEDSIADAPNPSTPDAPKTYTMTVTASKSTDDATTRALGLSGNTLTATWEEDDVIRVMKRREMQGNVDYALLGTLSATNVSTDGLTATFTGSITDDGLYVGDKLLLGYPGTKLGNSTSTFGFDYREQDGKIGTIASSYDYCMTSTAEDEMVTVASAKDGVVTTSGTASFDNQQAIVRFTLMDAFGNAIYPTSLDITAFGLVQSVFLPDNSGTGSSPAENTLTLNLDGSTNVVYAALRGISNKDVTLTVTTSEGYVYHYTKSGVTFYNGKYYTIDVKMKSDVVYLSTLNADYEAQDGDVLTGELPGGIHLTIAAGASVTLKDVTITNTSRSGIKCAGNAIINLVGTNSITSTSLYNSGIQVGGSGTKLTIQGSGSVTATGSTCGVGIGCRYNSTCGDITINGGTVTASGGYECAGIGSGGGGTCGNITISGGTVTATGGNKAAGIGSGNGGTCGAITISGTATGAATGGTGSTYDIGPGYNGSCGTVSVASGTISGSYPE